MEKPRALELLLDELASEGVENPIEVYPDTEALIFFDAKHSKEPDPVVLNAKECQLIFSSYENTEAFLKALPESKKTSIALYQINLESEICDLLERNLAAVDLY
jgi:hypothetical protein